MIKSWLIRAQYATDLGSRLRERIYTDVIPRLAESIAAARGMTSPTRADLDFHPTRWP